MPVADRIRKLGFRRWYERQLIEAHGSLVTAFLSVIMVAVCMDQFHWRDAGFKPLIMLALITAGIVLCFKTVRNYFSVLFRAEHLAAQAICGQCSLYGVIEVLGRPMADAATDDNLHVRCKKCGHGWRMSGTDAHVPAKKYL